MAVTTEQIRASLARFAADWKHYDRSERGGAQLFLNELLACYGVDLKSVGQLEFHQEGRFLDFIWPGVCIIEMKAPGEASRLSHHRQQALDYWRGAADVGRGIAAPPFVVLCAFHRFEVWEPGRFPSDPRLVFDLSELSERYDALLFLTGDEPVFEGSQAEVTRDAVGMLAAVNASLAERREGGPDERRAFLLQCVWCMFAEDLAQIPGRRFSRIVEELIADRRRSSADDLGRLFEYLNDPASDRPQHGLYAGTPYANGDLFAQPARLHLDLGELELMRQAAKFNWHAVQPQIFGSLLEGTLGHDKQWELGAHYTHESDIQQIVGPTIVDPWRERIASLERHDEAKRAQADLMRYVVLDPACGSGNFLYVAYRELRRIERDLAAREAELRAAAGLREQTTMNVFFPLANMRGIEIDPFAVSLARVTLWMGHQLVVEELNLDERTLPLVNLSCIRVGDALRLPWPRADAIVGNPPYHGSQNLRSMLDADYVDWLAEEFDCGLKDLCVYWFRKAADHMEPGSRAGLVGTNSVSQNRARGASLNYVIEKGGVITSAVSRQKWLGEAVVNVSIVNWVQQPSEPPARFVLDGEIVSGISTRLRESKLAIEEYDRLPVNAGRSFQGPIPAGAFYLSMEEAEQVIASSEAPYADVVRAYLIGDDITEEPEQQARRFVIDFAMRPLEAAMNYPDALQIVRERVKPARDQNNRKAYRDYWWRFAEPRPKMRLALEPLRRFIAGNAQGKRFLFVWCEPVVCPSNLTNVFAFEDDYAMGILTSSTHQAWAHAESSTLEDRPRYTPTSCFETFPWPDASADDRTAIGSLADELISRRQSICADLKIGLTDLYNQVDDGAWADLAVLHTRLDQAVAKAYGWPGAVAESPLEIRAHLAALHAEIVAGTRAYDPFAHLAPT